MIAIKEEKITAIRISKHEVYLFMACIDLKQEQIRRLLDETPMDKVGIIEGLCNEGTELNNLYQRLQTTLTNFT